MVSGYMKGTAKAPSRNGGRSELAGRPNEREMKTGSGASTGYLLGWASAHAEPERQTRTVARCGNGALLGMVQDWYRRMSPPVDIRAAASAIAGATCCGKAPTRYFWLGAGS